MPFTRVRQSLIQPYGSITGSLLGTASYAITSSYAMNGGSGGGGSPVVSVASLNNQTILYNFSSSQEATITGLTLTNNNWGINVVEEWNSVSIVGDEYYNSCSLLMHFSGSNNSTTFIDNSPNNFTVTSNNGAAISTAQSKFGGASGFFDGTNDYLSVPDNESLEPGTNNLTWEMWIKTTSSVQYATLYSRAPSGFASGMWSLMINAASSTAGDIALYVADYSNVTPLLLTTAVSIRDDVWHHIAIVRNGSAWVCYVDGTSRATGTFSGGINNLSSGPLIGADTFYGRYFNGYIDELRITKGVARYTSNFTPQTSEFPNNLNVTQYATKYIGLVGGLNDSNVDYGVEKLSDTSLKVRKMTASGQPLSGSGTLSASVDRVYVNVLNYTNVSVGSTLLGQTFTAVGSTSSYALSRSVVNPYEIIVAVDGAVQSFNDAYSVTSSTINFTESIPSGSLVDIRYLTTPNVNSASYALTASYALNGGSGGGGGAIQTGSIAGQTILYNFSSSQESTLTGLNLTGNKWGVNVIEEWDSGSGDIFYPSCSLLMHFSGSNGSTTFIDNSSNNLTITSNNGAKITSSISKFGGTSGFFDGTNDYLSLPSTITFPGDFTIEAWVYWAGGASFVQYAGIISNRTGNGVFAPIYLIGTAGNLEAGNWGINGYVGSSAQITSGVWNHVALVRSGLIMRFYINGVQDTSTGSVSGTLTASNLTIGSTPIPQYWNGYIDEVRITNGYARYTASFVTQSVQFPDSLPQYETKYIGLVGGLNDTGSDYGVQKLSDSSLKIRKMSVSGTPVSGSPVLSASVDRVYVNVLNYDNVSISGSISNAVTASFAQTTPSGKSIALSFILG